MRSDDKSYSKNLMRRKSPNWLRFRKLSGRGGYRVSRIAYRHHHLRSLWPSTPLSSSIFRDIEHSLEANRSEFCCRSHSNFVTATTPLPPERHRIQDEYMSTKMTSILIESMAYRKKITLKSIDFSVSLNRPFFFSSYSCPII